MTTIVERDSSPNAALIALLIMLLAVLGLGVAYWNGAFPGGTRVIENNHTTEKTTVLPAPAPQPQQPAQPAPNQPAP